MLIYGYARVSTREQNLDRQVVELQKYTDTIYADKERSDTTSSLTWGLTVINSNTASTPLTGGNNYYINTGVFLNATIAGTLFGGLAPYPLVL